MATDESQSRRGFLTSAVLTAAGSAVVGGSIAKVAEDKGFQDGILACTSRDNVLSAPSVIESVIRQYARDSESLKTLAAVIYSIYNDQISNGPSYAIREQAKQEWKQIAAFLKEEKGWQAPTEQTR